MTLVYKVWMSTSKIVKYLVEVMQMKTVKMG